MSKTSNTEEVVSSNKGEETTEVEENFEQVEIDDEIIAAETAAFEFRKHGHSAKYQECWKKCKALERYFKFLAEANPTRVEQYYKVFINIQTKEVRNWYEQKHCKEVK